MSVFNVTIIEDLKQSPAVRPRMIKCTAYNHTVQAAYNGLYLFEPNHMENTVLRDKNITCYVNLGGSKETTFIDRFYMYKWLSVWMMTAIGLLVVVATLSVWICCTGWCRCSQVC